MLAVLDRFLQVSGERNLQGLERRLFFVLLAIMVLLVFYEAGPPYAGNIGSGVSGGTFLLIVHALILMKHPAAAGASPNRVPWYDWLIIAASSASLGYWIIEFKDIIARTGAPTEADLWFGSILVFVSIEVARRSLGWVVALMGALAMLYGLFGNHFPIEQFSHSGLSWTTLISGIYSISGIFGFILSIVMTYIVMFVIVGGMLQAFGAGVLLVELPFALFGRVRGGPGIASVAASTMFGMISGSATANTAATGAFTIPVMKRAGYPPHIAGAIEPAASTGGMFMPPIMGAGAFIMAEMTGVPYLTIVAVSVAPALIYFFAVAVSCYTEAGRFGITTIPRAELPRIWPLVRRGWIYLVPVALLIGLMVYGQTPPRSAFWAVVATIVLTTAWQFASRKKGTSIGEVGLEAVRNLGEGVRLSGNSGLVVASLTGIIGIIVTVVFQTGVGFMLTSSVLDLTGGVLVWAIVLALLLSLVLGMGMPVTSVYILLAVLVAPALKEVGMPILAAHMLLFWYSQTANISPPVAIAAFVGAGIAGANPFRTSIAAFRYSIFLFILPVLFVYTPILMPNGFTIEVFTIMAGAFLSTIAFAAAFSGYLLRHATALERVLFFAAGIGLVYPQIYATVAGLLMLVGLIAVQGMSRRKGAVERPQPGTAE
jgi:TRAP transporter 4TM/12TM fusion protein